MSIWRRIVENKFLNWNTKIIGSLMYITNCTRPDIACAVNNLCRFTSNPSDAHWKALTKVLRYLKHTSEYGLNYTRYPAVLEGYCDANWISDTHDSKLTSGYVFSNGGGAVSWRSSKQTCIARSTMESEFIALDKATEEAEWLRNFLEDIPLYKSSASDLDTFATDSRQLQGHKTVCTMASLDTYVEDIILCDS
ncbi:secreted RxLR effector protein 161-like [Primulina tabacum]|uniref:secreted RxLR effector protein 161-like n=1 Tax=Primulina tabacum TaxID=48773 RepID=UPI003F5AD0AF